MPELASDVILFDTICRFKGLERPVIVLVEFVAGVSARTRSVAPGEQKA